MLFYFISFFPCFFTAFKSFFYTRFRLKRLQEDYDEKARVFEQAQLDAGNVEIRLNEARAEMELAKKNLAEYDFYYFLKIFSL